MMRVQNNFEENSARFEQNLDGRLRDLRDIDQKFSGKFEKEFHVLL